MTAQTLDGKATARAIKADLTERVVKLREQGVVPGLGTVLVGDDPGSHSYVAGKHRDCAQVGIESIQVELPGSATQETVDAAVHQLNADPRCTGYLVQLPLPAGLDANHVLELVDPAKDADGLHPMNLGRLVIGRGGHAPVHAPRHRRAAPLVRRRARRRRRVRDRAWTHGGTTPRPAADPALGECHRHAVPHRNPRPGQPRPPRQHRRVGCRSPGSGDRRHGQAGSRRSRRRDQSHRAVAWSVTSIPRCATSQPSSHPCREE